MKKIILFFTLSLAILSIKGQTNIYHPFPDSNAVWKELLGCMGPHPYPYCFYGQNFQGGDTVINSINYKKIYSQGIDVYCTQTTTIPSFEGGIRQDINSRKIYFWSQLSGTEELLYDFNLNVGDPITPSYITSSGSVLSIDSIQLNDGTYRKIWNCYDSTWSFTPFYTIIEGIGSEGGLFRNKDSEYGNWLCSFINDTTLLFGVNNCVTASDTCQNVGIHEIDNMENAVYVFPNPASSFFVLSTGTKEIISACVINTMGEKLFEIKEITSQNIIVDLSNQSDGMYFVIVQLKDRRLVRKLAKHN